MCLMSLIVSSNHKRTTCRVQERYVALHAGSDRTYGEFSLKTWANDFFFLLEKLLFTFCCRNAIIAFFCEFNKNLSLVKLNKNEYIPR